MVPARPFFMGSDGWVRSSACTWLFSSRQSTTAFSGGFRYSPTTSTSFSSNRGSFDSLNVSTRCGCSPRARQTRCTVSRLTPTRAAIVRVDQCVAPGGVSCTVTRTISSTVSAGIDGLRPRPSRTSAKRASPSSANRDRHARTVTAVTPTAAAICTFGRPSAAISSACARRTSRNGAVPDRASTSNASR